MIEYLTTAQRDHIYSLERGLSARNVAVRGFDLARRPVVSRRDVNGVATYAIQPDGRGVHVVNPVTDLTDDEVACFNPRDHHFIRSFPASLEAT